MLVHISLSRFSAVRVPDPLPAVAADDSAESTFIPSNLSRWREESIALDSLTASFCVAAVRTKLVARLSEIFEKEQADKKSASSALGVQVVPTGHPESISNTHVVPSVPNPSDEVTPSAPTPRATSASVEQMQSSLQSSLRAVADALAQTVVRSLGSQGSGGGDAATRTDLEATDVTDISSRRTTVRTVGEIEEGSSSMEALPEPPPLEMVPPPPPSDRQESVGAAGVSVLSTFDGSQESARATLANTDPSDPLYTFLSAVAGAPAPPLPESSLETSSRSPSHHQPSSLSPRLPIFTQLQSSPAVTLAASGGALPLSVIQGPRTVGQTTQSTGSTVIVPQFAVAPPTSSPSNSSQGSSQAEPVDLWQPYPASCGPAHPESEQLTDPLVRRPGSPLPQNEQGTTVPADNATPYATSSAASAHVDAATESLPLPMPTSTTTSSPSPSDTLAPLLLSSLQVAVSGRSSPPSTTSGGLPVIPHPDRGDTGLRGQANVPLPLGHEVDPNQTVTLSTTGQTVTQISDSQDASAQVAGSSSGQATSSEQVSSRIADEVASRIASQVTSQATLEQAGGAASSSTTRDEAEEIDPTFLAALPEAIRQEVLLQHERERRLRQQPSTISPEFLAALPPEIQDEVRSWSVTSRSLYIGISRSPCTHSSWEYWYLCVHL